MTGGSFLSLKGFLSAAAIALTFLAFLPYIVSILRGSTRPHVFSWIIWGTTTCVVFLAQRADGGGVGAWPIGVSGLITLLVALLAWRGRADVSITAPDWLFLGAALSALPFWYLTADPLWAVVILTTVDVLGFGPTFRKTWHAPHTESLAFPGLFALRNLLVLLALEHYSLTTALFPAAIAIACLLLGAMIVYRRQTLA